MRVVLDTNVILSGLLWKKATKEIYDLAAEKKITIYLTPRIISEINRTLNYPKIYKQLEIIGLTRAEVIEYLLQISEFTSDLALNVELSDESDKVFLGAAVTSHAEFIVTGDKHLLSLKKFQGIKIIRPRQFLERF